MESLKNHSLAIARMLTRFARYRFRCGQCSGCMSTALAWLPASWTAIGLQHKKCSLCRDSSGGEDRRKRVAGRDWAVVNSARIPFFACCGHGFNESTEKLKHFPQPALVDGSAGGAGGQGWAGPGWKAVCEEEHGNSTSMRVHTMRSTRAEDRVIETAHAEAKKVPWNVSNAQLLRLLGATIELTARRSSIREARRHRI
ncbi:hypothetical protein MPTK1_1g22300 [Marchantia polymorpha subsp. ruderalis]|uniref:Uncharacterized protein n=2 Tax=Marchantia polymorpha TaxID=3197 RepID=A0AAF6AT29_MARPO|nr:hypothetical protein MARPO_0001s0568 [Marchantia polymorpha]BBM99599.1 hypothetical protein Mp_1g22300 [Marchantia polymorpha subsp. ruderalis]|eukprot:PTQ50687.1 hypothetical protein MARPO_0001s0568 [Marchantia polymorpha]